MAEYIERETFINEIRNIHAKHGLKGNEEMLFSETDIIGIVECLPTADVAPVVRCLECAEFDQNNCGLPFGLCCQWEQYTDCDGFCYRGKRKDDDHDG